MRVGMMVQAGEQRRPRNHKQVKDYARFSKDRKAKLTSLNYTRTERDWGLQGA